jgi:alpha-D-xyloside xylohydrolase
VTEPGATTRRMYLPKGIWYDFWTGKRVDGGATIDTAAPIERMPLFVRAGSIVPMGPELEYASEKPADPIEIRIFTGASGSFVLYEDEGDNYDYEKGAHATIRFDWDEAAKKLTIDKRTGQFPGMLEHRTFHIVFTDADHGTGIELSKRTDKVVEYSGNAIAISR